MAMNSETLTRRARRGTGETQARAAQRAGISPQTMAAYETGRVTPTPARTAVMMRQLALGTPAPDEADPHVFVAYTLGGMRLLADPDGMPVAFPSAETANAIASLLDSEPFAALH